MPFTAGIFTRIQGSTRWRDDASTGTKILALDHDENDNDIGDALSQAILKNGTQTIGANIPWGGFKILNLGDGTADTDAANMKNVRAQKNFTTGISITGSDENGRITFGPGTTGALGLSFTTAGMFWGAKIGVADETYNRMVLANTATPPDTGNANDVFIVDRRGAINCNGQITNNLSYSFNDSLWRTINAGTGSLLSYINGSFVLQSNDVATTADNYVTATLRTFFSVANSTNGTIMSLRKSASGKYNYLDGYMASSIRWRMALGDSVVESGGTAGRVGSNFSIASYANDGSAGVQAMHINRETNKVTFAGEVLATNLTTTDPTMTVGPVEAGTDFKMQRTNADASFHIYGGLTGGAGSYLSLYGSGYLTPDSASDIILGSNGSYRYWYDHSAQTHHFRSSTADIATMTTTGLAVTGTITAANVTLTGTVTATNVIITDNNMVIGPTTAGSTFAMSRPSPVDDGAFVIYAGQSNVTGATLYLYGKDHASAGNDYAFYAEGAATYRYDYSLGTHTFYDDAINVMSATKTAFTVPGTITSGGNIRSSGIIETNQNFDSTSTTCILSATAGGIIRLMPDGTATTSTQTVFDSVGSIQVCNSLGTATGGVYAGKGLRGKLGETKAYGGEWINFDWTGTVLNCYVGDVAHNVSPTACDYRIKRDIVPLGSVWDKVKALKPISYRQAAFQGWVDDDAERWGFAAHELQQALGQHAATGEKDGEQVQFPSLLGLLAAVTKALQEAMQRIETLEAAA